MSSSHKVIMIGEDQNDEDFFCPICLFPLKSYEDFFYKEDYNCCNECYLTFAEARRKEWKEGWRPNKTTTEQYIYNRKLMFNIEEKK
jgi:hypothetical protein